MKSQNYLHFNSYATILLELRVRNVELLIPPSDLMKSCSIWPRLALAASKTLHRLNGLDMGAFLSVFRAISFYIQFLCRHFQFLGLASRHRNVSLRIPLRRNRFLSCKIRESFLVYRFCCSLYLFLCPWCSWVGRARLWRVCFGSRCEVCAAKTSGSRKSICYL